MRGEDDWLVRSFIKAIVECLVSDKMLTAGRAK